MEDLILVRYAHFVLALSTSDCEAFIFGADLSLALIYMRHSVVQFYHPYVLIN